MANVRLPGKVKWNKAGGAKNPNKQAKTKIAKVGNAGDGN